MEEFFKGDKLYGNDFNLEEITKWYKEEEEGYSEIDSRELTLLDQGIYLYENINKVHGFDYFNKNKKYSKVLGIGSATGHEFLPIKDLIEDLYIIEPSEKLKGNKINNKEINYVKPQIDGSMVFENNFFNLTTSFGVLHHIPNVSFVLSEIYRTLEKDGYFMLREPIVSLGDWREKRDGLTKNERGLPIDFLKKEIEELGFKIVGESYCFTLSNFLSKLTEPILSKPIFAYRPYVIFDRFISNLLKKNITYHRKSRFNRFFPKSVFLVLQK